MDHTAKNMKTMSEKKLKLLNSQVKSPCIMRPILSMAKVAFFHKHEREGLCIVSGKIMLWW